MIILLIVLLVLVVLAIAYFAWLLVITLASLINGRPPSIGTPREVLPQIVKALDLKSNSTLYDLGCGDGRVLAVAHKSAPRAKLLGFDTNRLILIRAYREKALKQANKQLICQNFFKLDLSPASHIFCYLSDEMMANLEPKFDRELSKKARLVSLDYPLPHRSPTRKIALGDGRKLGRVLYVYDF